jgi:N-acetylglucosaminyldiphosphoundecaprenol N-acetyl-beta-D-mannosaminyltransferase
MSDFPTAEALTVSCFAGSVDRAADLVVSRALSGEGGFAVLCNVHVLTTSQRDPGLRAALEEAWAVFPDGAPVAWLLRRSGAANARRVAGNELMSAVIERGIARELRHYFVGSTPYVLNKLERNLLRRFPGIQLVGSAGPFGNEATLDSVVVQICETEPHVVWCAFGAPKQELWMKRNASALTPALALGVGAAFDFLAGTKKRAPVWMQRSGLEWLHRLKSEPRRLAGRYAVTNSEFLVRASAQLARRRSS